MSAVKLILQTNITTMRHLGTAMTSSPLPTSKLELAKGDGYSLRAGRSVFKGGVAIHLHHGKNSWALAGFTASELKGSDGGLLVTTLIERAERYANEMKPAESMARVQAEYEKPWTAEDKAALARVFDTLESLVPKMSKQELLTILAKHRQLPKEGV